MSAIKSKAEAEAMTRPLMSQDLEPKESWVVWTEDTEDYVERFDTEEEALIEYYGRIKNNTYSWSFTLAKVIATHEVKKP